MASDIQPILQNKNDKDMHLFVHILYKVIKVNVSFSEAYTKNSVNQTMKEIIYFKVFHVASHFEMSDTEFVCISYIPHAYSMSHLILLDLIALRILCEECSLLS
jgi:hypothetical protein